MGCAGSAAREREAAAKELAAAKGLAAAQYQIAAQSKGLQQAQMAQMAQTKDAQIAALTRALFQSRAQHFAHIRGGVPSFGPGDDPGAEPCRTRRIRDAAHAGGRR